MSGFLISDLAAQQIVKVSRAVDYNIRDSVDNYGNLYISAWSQLPSVLTFINSGGSVTICSSDENAKITYIYEYDINLQEQKTIIFKRE